jgi:hypothetical protein
MTEDDKSNPADPWLHGQSYTVARPPAVSGVERVMGGTCQNIPPAETGGEMHEQRL